MSWNLPVSGSGEDRPVLPAGLYVARCVLLFDLGTQAGGKYGAKPKLVIGWELPENTHVFDESAGPEPMFLSRFFGANMSSKGHFRPFLEAWRGARFSDDEARAFDITQILGAPCFLNVMPERKEGTDDWYNKVTGVARIDQNAAGNMPSQVLPSRLFLFRAPDGTQFDGMPEFMRKIAAQSPEYANWCSGMTAPAAQNAPVTPSAGMTPQQSPPPAQMAPATSQPANTMVSAGTPQPLPQGQAGNPHYVQPPSQQAAPAAPPTASGPTLDTSTAQTDPNRPAVEDEIPF